MSSLVLELISHIIGRLCLDPFMIRGEKRHSHLLWLKYHLEDEVKSALAGFFSLHSQEGESGQAAQMDVSPLGQMSI